VVIGILSSGDTIGITLSQTLVTGTKPNPAPYPEARVYISVQDSAWKELKRIRKYSCAFIDTTKHNLAIVGKTYHLKVELASTTLTATTQVPHETIQTTDAYFTINAKYNNGQMSGELSIVHSPILNSSFTYTCDMEYPENKSQNGQFLIDVSKNVFSRDWYENDTSTCMVGINTFNNDIQNLSKSIEIASQNGQINNSKVGLITAMMSYGGTMPQYNNIKNGYGLFSAYAKGNKVKLRMIIK
jgi:hypothetical protein